VEPPYRQIVSDVRRRIEAGELRPGDRVPSARAITREWGVAIATATKAHAALREEGLTVARPGVGTVVAGPSAAHDRELTLPRIVTAAIALADRDGLADLSMRRLAGELGVATMSLYRHIPSRDDLLLGMIDAAIGTVPLPPRPPRGWRAGLDLVARREWAVFQRHPWLGPSMSLTRPQLAPNAMRLTEFVLAAFDGTRLTFAERMYVQVMLFSFVRGLASALEPEVEAQRDSGLTADEWMQSQEKTFVAIMHSDAFPHFHALADEEFDLDLDSLFEFGLTRLLDGLETLVKSRAELDLSEQTPRSDRAGGEHPV
jgi:DNA-binding transcriptional regulator YhcF (GntR family)